MKSNGISEEVRQLIHGHISSVMQLEVLLFLHARARKEWSVAELVREFRVDPGWIESELDELCAAGLLLVVEGTGRAYRYAPTTPELESAVIGLAKTYTDRRVTVTGLIYAKPVGNIHVFADAFNRREV